MAALGWMAALAFFFLWWGERRYVAVLTESGERAELRHAHVVEALREEHDRTWTRMEQRHELTIGWFRESHAAELARLTTSLTTAFEAATRVVQTGSASPAVAVVGSNVEQANREQSEYMIAEGARRLAMEYESAGIDVPPLDDLRAEAAQIIHGVGITADPNRHLIPRD